MTATTNFLAVDLGASNGRVLLAKWDGERFHLEALHLRMRLRIARLRRTGVPARMVCGQGSWRADALSGRSGRTRLDSVTSTGPWPPTIGHLLRASIARILKALRHGPVVGPQTGGAATPGYECSFGHTCP